MERFLKRASKPVEIRVALVNNMPDAAFLDTESQFRSAVLGGSSAGVGLELYTIKEMPRSEKLAPVIKNRYRGLDELWADPPDALIITGTEPTQADLRSEPYWPFLAQLLDWAADNVQTALLSCLAAHASLLRFDGIRRTRRAAKCSGVFEGIVRDARDPLARGLSDSVRMPHSRMNDVPQEALIEAGYRVVIATGSSGVGWSLAAREHRNALFVLCQGHPEYSALSLLREYRRDVRRCLFGEGVIPYPRLPEGYLHDDAVEMLARFERRANGTRVSPTQLWPSFPFGAVAQTIENTWAPLSATLYSNWLQLVQPTPARHAPGPVLHRAVA